MFYLLAGFAIACAISLVVHRNPLYSAISLVGVFLSLSCIYFTLAAPFIAAVQVLIYAGAIMVLIIFVIMLLNLRRESVGVWGGRPQRTLAGFAALLFIALVARAILPMSAGAVRGGTTAFGSVELIGRSLYSDYFYPFELISLILLAAMAGAVVLAKKKL